MTWKRSISVLAVAATVTALSAAVAAGPAQSAPAPAPVAHGTPKPWTPPRLNGASNGKAHFAVLPRTSTGGKTNAPTQGNATFTPNAASDLQNPPAGSPGGTAQGPIMTHPVIYNIFWLPAGNHFEPDNLASSDTSYENIVNQFSHDIGGDEYYGINTQYPGSNGTPQNAVTFGGSTLDTGAYPKAGTSAAPLLESDINAKVNAVATAKSWPTGLNDLFVVWTAAGIQECDGTAHNFCTPGTTAVKGNFCAYHQFTTPPHAYMPSACYTRAPSPSPNNDQDADSSVEIFTHELFESVTDPNGNAWQAPGGASAEIGDLCNAQNGYVNANGANAYLNGHGYTVELQWSNAVHGCVESLHSGSVSPPAVTMTKSVDNASPTVGSTVHYTVTIANSSNTGPATNLVFSDTLPAGYTVSDVSDPGSSSDSWSPGGGSVTVDYDSLPVHQSVTLVISATVPNQPLHTATNCGSLTLQDEVTADQPAVMTSPCASTTPKDQPIALTALAATGTEGTSTIPLATLTDPDPDATAGEYAATVDWGDGTTSAGTISGPTHGPWTVAGTHLYLEEGTYAAKVSVADISDDPTNTATANVTVLVGDAALSAGPTAHLSAVEGAPWSGQVGTFTDADPNGTVSDYSATIDWGDGTSSAGTIGGGPTFTVSGSHTYLEEGPYSVSIAIGDAGGATTTGHASFAVADAALTGNGLSFNASNPVSATVATFTDADPNGTVSDYSATIDWGDGTTSAGTIGGGPTFTVSGTHTYAGTGSFTFTVKTHICDAGGACTDTTGTLKITYMTGRAYGASVSLVTPRRSVHVGPLPDTGSIANSLASTTHTPCTLSLNVVVLVVKGLCANVTTSITPHSSTATAWLSTAKVSTGILGVPVINVTALKTVSTSSCDAASGTTTIASLVVGGHTITVSGHVNLVVPILGYPGARLIVNEQVGTTGPNGDRQLTVNGLHLIVPTLLGTSADFVIASATSDIHNCGSAAPMATFHPTGALHAQ